jgi:hypothetical protein
VQPPMAGGGHPGAREEERWMPYIGGKLLDGGAMLRREGYPIKSRYNERHRQARVGGGPAGKRRCGPTGA